MAKNVQNCIMTNRFMLLCKVDNINLIFAFDLFIAIVKLLDLHQY